MKETPPPVILFYHSINGFVLIWIYILIEYGITNELRMSEYTLDMWLIVYGAAYFDCCAMLSNVIAFQNDSAGLAGLLSNIIIVYSFLGDIIIF